MAPENPPLEKERIYELFFEIAKSEQDFNTLQTKYRQMASLWMLGAFAAVGYLLSKEPGQMYNDTYINGYIISFVICVSTNIGLVLLWTTDILVYHRLLDAYFVEGLVLERTYNFLPPVRHLMRRDEGRGKGVIYPLVNFYVVPMWVFTIFAAAASILYLHSLFSFWKWNSDSAITLMYVLVVFLIAVSLCVWIYRTMHRMSKNTQLFDDWRLRGHKKSLPLPSALTPPPP